MIKKEGAVVEIKPKLINGRPFLEITWYDKVNYQGSGKAIDSTTIGINDTESLYELIMKGLYEY